MCNLSKILFSLVVAFAVLIFCNILGDIAYIPSKSPKRGFFVVVNNPIVAKAVDDEAIEVVKSVEVKSVEVKSTIAKGERVAKKCIACHSFDNGVAKKFGPELFGIVGDDIASVKGYEYSDAFLKLKGKWDRKTLAEFLKNPMVFAKGSKMMFSGLKDEGDINNLMDYLESLDKNNIE